MPGIVSKLVDKVKEQTPKKKQPWELMVIPFKKQICEQGRLAIV